MNRYQQTEKIKQTYKNELPKPKQAWPPNVQQAFTFIVAHLFDSRLTVAWIKEQCRINEKSFPSQFCMHVNRYPKEYIQHHRIEAAKKLLKKTEASATTVAISVGYNSLSSFANTFKAREGMTPSKWREQN